MASPGAKYPRMKMMNDTPSSTNTRPASRRTMKRGPMRAVANAMIASNTTTARMANTFTDLHLSSRVPCRAGPVVVCRGHWPRAARRHHSCRVRIGRMLSRRTPQLSYYMPARIPREMRAPDRWESGAYQMLPARRHARMRRERLMPEIAWAGWPGLGRDYSTRSTRVANECRAGVSWHRCRPALDAGDLAYARRWGSSQAWPGSLPHLG